MTEATKYGKTFKVETDAAAALVALRRASLASGG